jgi:hypothetical protein
MRERLKGGQRLGALTETMLDEIPDNALHV